MIKQFQRTRRKQGFTLIELLIVVAIIAILAAIAIPNFLEAQTRSKVARVKSDMRTMATAIEAYCIDSNKYLPTHHQGYGEVTDVEAMAAMPGSSDPTPYDCLEVCGRRLTTPISYLSAIPYPSPFFERETIWGRRGFWFATVQRPDPMSYDMWYGGSAYWGNGTARWFLMDGGPDRSWFADTGNPDPYVRWEAQIPYDPTNGTISRGNLWWVGGGGHN